MPILQADERAQAVPQAALPPATAPGTGRRAIRPLRVVLLNGAEEKSDGDLRIARLLGNSALQLELTILRDQHAGERDISPHLLHFYRTFAEVQTRTYDALVVVGCDHDRGRRPGPGRESELAEAIAWSWRQGHAGLVLGAASYAVLDLCYGVGARRLPARQTGVVRHRLVAADEALLRGHGRCVWVPVVDGRGLERGDLPAGGALSCLAESAEAGIHILRDAARRFTVVLNDISADAEASAPPPGEGSAGRMRRPGDGTPGHGRGWRSHAQLLFANWLAFEVARLSAPAALPFAPAGAVAHQGATAAG